MVACFGMECFGVKPKEQINSLFTVDAQQLLSSPQKYSNRGVDIDSEIASAVPANQLRARWKGYLPWTFWTRDTAFRRGKVVPRTISACRFKRGIIATFDNCIIDLVDDRHLVVHRMTKGSRRLIYEDRRRSAEIAPNQLEQPIDLHQLKGTELHKIKLVAARIFVEGACQLNVNERHGPVWHFKFDSSEELLQWLATLQNVPGLYRRPEDFYEIYEELGQGATCRVFKCRSKTSGKLYVMKYRANKDDNLSSRLMHNELKILQICARDPYRHPSIPELEDFFFEPTGDIQIVQELMSGGELFKHIAKLKHFSELKARDLTRQIVEGVAYLHQHDIAHRDLKPANLIFTSKEPDARLKILDFDLSKVNYAPTWEASTPCGTTQYMAPEVVDATKYDKSVDMWSLGVIVFMMIAGHGPFKGRNDNVTEDNIRNHRYQFKGAAWEGVSVFCKDFINELLSMNPADRPTAEQALQHPWLTLLEHEVPNEPIHTHSYLRRANSLDGVDTLDVRHHRRALPEVLQVDLRPFDLHLATQVGLTNQKPAVGPGTTATRGGFARPARPSLETKSKAYSPRASDGEAARAQRVNSQTAALRSRQEAKRQREIAALRQSLHLNMGAGLTSSVAPEPPTGLSPSVSRHQIADDGDDVTGGSPPRPSMLARFNSDIASMVREEQLKVKYVEAGPPPAETAPQLEVTKSIGRNMQGYKVILPVEPELGQSGPSLRDIVAASGVGLTAVSRRGTGLEDSASEEASRLMETGPSEEEAGGHAQGTDGRMVLSKQFRNEQQVSSLRRNMWSSPNFAQEAGSMASMGRNRSVARQIAMAQIQRVSGRGERNVV